jgi:hypothetical protein
MQKIGEKKKWKAVEIKKQRIKERREKFENQGKPILVNMTALKKRMRDLKRLIARPNISEEIKAQKQGDLEKLQSKLEEVAAAKNFHLKYKQAIFIEKRKTFRIIEKQEKVIRKLMKKNDGSSEMALKISEENALLDQAKKNLDYIRYFPKTEKYLSLYKESTPERQIKLDEMWAKVESTKKEIESGNAEDWYAALYPQQNKDSNEQNEGKEGGEIFADSEDESAERDQVYDDDDFFV